MKKNTTLPKLTQAELGYLHLPEHKPGHHSFVHKRHQGAAAGLVYFGLMEHAQEADGGPSYVGITKTGVALRKRIAKLPIEEFVRYVKLSKSQLDWLSAVTNDRRMTYRLDTGHEHRVLLTLINYGLLKKGSRTHSLLGDPVDVTALGIRYLAQVAKVAHDKYIKGRAADGA